MYQVPAPACQPKGEALMHEQSIPLFIGFRLLNTPTPAVGFGCGECLKPHIHPDKGGSLQRFETVCTDPDPDQHAAVYDLLIVGAVPGRADLPYPPEGDEADDLHQLLAAVPRQ